MAIEFTGVDKTFIYFTTPDIITTTVSITGRSYIPSVIDNRVFINGYGIAGISINTNSSTQGGSGKLRFEQIDNYYGKWFTNNTFPLNEYFNWAITHDNSSIDNDPIIYINSVDVAITEYNQPVDSGAYYINSDIIGSGNIDDTTITGKLQDVRIYNRILSASEIAELYNSRCQRAVMDGLVFWPEMDGAAGLSSFDGATLSSANTIVDRISGVQGIPSGSPIGRGNTIQRIY